MGSHKRLFAVVSIFVSILFFIAGCDSPNGPGTGQPLVTASSPRNNTTSQDMNITLEWDYSDSVTAAITFNVYFGMAGSPPLAAEDLTETKFTPGVLNKNTIYYWRVQVIDSGTIVSSSPVYKFMTGDRFTYPLKVGYFWKYLQTYQSFNFNPPELADEHGYDERYYVYANIKDTLTLPDSTPTFAFHSWATDTSIAWHTRESVAFINNTDSGLCLYAYIGPSMIVPKPKADDGKIFYRFQGRTYERIEDLIFFEKELIGNSSLAAFDPAIYYEDPPVYSLRYPLVEDMQWVYRTADNPWRIDKRVTGWAELNTTAGSFEVLQIAWLWDMNDDGQWDDDLQGYDYVGPKGLIKRAFLYEGIEVISYETPGVPLGTMDVIEEYELIEYTLD